MKSINGVYLGWISPQSKSWEPLYRTIQCEHGYESEYTQLSVPAVKRYPGLRESLDFNPDPWRLPFALNRRIPKVRADYERDARTLNLPDPIPNLFEYVGRTGGLFSGDPFSICPIVEPNDDGSYSYESLLWKFDPEVRQSLTTTSQLKAIITNGKPLITTTDERVLGELLPNFIHLGTTIFNVKLIGICEKHYFGGGDILVSFDTSLNLYTTPIFALTNRELASV